MLRAFYRSRARWAERDSAGALVEEDRWRRQRATHACGRYSSEWQSGLARPLQPPRSAAEKQPDDRGVDGDVPSDGDEGLEVPVVCEEEEGQSQQKAGQEEQTYATLDTRRLAPPPVGAQWC